MEIVTKKVADLKGWRRNPRTISEDALKGLEASIDRFGLVEPIIWNKQTKHVVGGHQRLKVLRRNEVDETQVIVVDIPESEEMTLNVTLNNPAIAGIFTEETSSILEEIRQNNSDLFFDLKLDQIRLPENFVDDFMTHEERMQEWEGMPEFDNEEIMSKSKIIVHFRTDEDKLKFGKLIEQELSTDTKFVWYPRMERKPRGTCKDES